MALNLAEELHKKYPMQPFDKNFVRGYSDEEIKKIERLYDIEVPPTSQLYEFLRCMGRCSGGLFGDYILLYYIESGNINNKVLFQYFCREEIVELGFLSAEDDKVFFISCMHETQNYFLTTRAEDVNIIYHWDENTDEIIKTSWTLYQYLEWILSSGFAGSFTCSVQELIKISGEIIEF